jgi:hypothetical protein
VANPFESVNAHLKQCLCPTSSSPAGRPESVFRTFRRFNRARRGKKHCELCDICLHEDHRHLFEISNGRIVCACDACALRFQAVNEGRFKLIPRSIRSLPELDFDDNVWKNLRFPSISPSSSAAASKVKSKRSIRVLPAQPSRYYRSTHGTR